MKRITSLLLVLAVLLCGCSTVNEGIVPGNNVAADEQDAFVHDADSEDVPGTKISLESLVTDKEGQETPIVEEALEKKESSTEEEKPISPTVYRTESGECYHREGCYHLKSKFKTTVERAQAMGLRECSRCHPPR